MTNALFFDLDGTLVNREIGAKNWLYSQFKNFSQSTDAFAAFYADFQQIDSLGRNSKLETFGQLANKWNWERNAEEIWSDYRRDVWRFCELFSDVHPTLTQLKMEGYKLGIITNGTIECQQAKIEALGLPELVNCSLISEREGYKKPAPELFLRACERLNEEPQNCLMVGDSLKADVEGAINAGVKGIFLDRNSESEKVTCFPQINSLSELFSHL